MNAAQHENLSKLISELEDIKHQLEVMQCEEQEKCDSGLDLEENAQCLEDAVTQLGSIISNLGDIDSYF